MLNECTVVTVSVTVREISSLKLGELNKTSDSELKSLFITNLELLIVIEPFHWTLIRTVTVRVRLRLSLSGSLCECKSLGEIQSKFMDKISI